MPVKRKLDLLDRPAFIRALVSVVLGLGVLYYGYSGGRGPAFLSPGWLMVIGAALIGYGLLSLLRLAWLRRQLELSPAELARWGPALVKATPLILQELERRKPVAAVARRVQQENGIPELVTLKYVIALGRYSEAERQRAAREPDEGRDDGQDIRE